MIGQLGMVYGMPIIEDDKLIRDKQIRFPKSKGKRIRKKWRKNKHNFICVPDTETILNTPMGLICHPVLAERLIRELGDSNDGIRPCIN